MEKALAPVAAYPPGRCTNSASRNLSESASNVHPLLGTSKVASTMETQLGLQNTSTRGTTGHIECTVAFDSGCGE